jgi:hypothetical protein
MTALAAPLTGTFGGVPIRRFTVDEHHRLLAAGILPDGECRRRSKRTCRRAGREFPRGCRGGGRTPSGGSLRMARPAYRV